MSAQNVWYHRVKLPCGVVCLMESYVHQIARCFPVWVEKCCGLATVDDHQILSHDSGNHAPYLCHTSFKSEIIAAYFLRCRKNPACLNSHRYQQYSAAAFEDKSLSHLAESEYSFLFLEDFELQLELTVVL
jgi:hypothetical protein